MTDPNKLQKVTAIRSRMETLEKSYLDIPKTDPWVPILLRDTEYKMELSYESAQKIQREFNLNIFAGELTMEHLNNMETMVRVLVIGIQTHHPEVTVESIAPKIMVKHRAYYAHCVAKALEATQPDYSDLVAILGEAKDVLDGDEEAGDSTDAPLPEIVSSPVFGQPVE